MARNPSPGQPLCMVPLPPCPRLWIQQQPLLRDLPRPLRPLRERSESHRGLHPRPWEREIRHLHPQLLPDAAFPLWLQDSACTPPPGTGEMAPKRRCGASSASLAGRVRLDHPRTPLLLFLDATFMLKTITWFLEGRQSQDVPPIKN